MNLSDLIAGAQSAPPGKMGPAIPRDQASAALRGQGASPAAPAGGGQNSAMIAALLNALSARGGAQQPGGGGIPRGVPQQAPEASPSGQGQLPPEVLADQQAGIPSAAGGQPADLESILRQ